MLKPKYNILLNGKYFDAIYPVDYYNDKKIFHDSGARQFFVIFHLAESRKHEIEIEEITSGSKIAVPDEIYFRKWTKDHYPMYLNYLDNYN